jgi:hypothetical protein
MANNEFIQQAKIFIANVELNPAAAAICKEISVTGIFGPSKSGKHSVLAMTETPVAIWDTSRPLLISDPVDKHNHLTTDSELQQVLDDLQHGNYVHAMIHSDTKEFYGVKADQYTKTDTGNILVDMASERIRAVRHSVLFRNVAELMIVPSSYNQWQGMFLASSTGPAGVPEAFFKRSEHVLKSGLRTTGLYVVPNDHVMTTAKIVDDFAEGGHIDYDIKRRGRLAAREVLARLKVRSPKSTA